MYLQKQRIRHVQTDGKRTTSSRKLTAEIPVVSDCFQSTLPTPCDLSPLWRLCGQLIRAAFPTQHQPPGSQTVCSTGVTLQAFSFPLNAFPINLLNPFLCLAYLCHRTQNHPLQS